MPQLAEGPFGTFAGLATGSLIGLLGGPVGLAVGAVAGTLTGSLFDLARLGVSDDFLTEVYLNLVPNKWAVVAEVDETWVTPLDSRMDAIGGVVFRRGRGEFLDIQIEREIAADKAEFQRLETEYKQAVGEAKTKLKVKVDAARKRYQERRELLLKRVAEIEREGEAKLKLLQEQVAKTTGQAKANLEKRVADEPQNTTRALRGFDRLGNWSKKQLRFKVRAVNNRYIGSTQARSRRNRLGAGTSISQISRKCRGA